MSVKLDILSRLYKSKEVYDNLSNVEKREITKLVSGEERPERIILNISKIKDSGGGSDDW